MNGESTIKVLIVEPMEKSRIAEIGSDLTSMQEVVGGYIEQFMPFDEDIAIVCNEQGKLEGLPLNRAVRDKNGEIMDVIAGTFFVCYAPFESENFESLTDEQQKKYGDKFKYPERFSLVGDNVKVIPIKPVNRDQER